MENYMVHEPHIYNQMAAAAALRATTDGVLLDLSVVPGAAASRFPAGYDQWRERIEARVRAPPRDGAANEELATMVAQFFGVRSDAVAVVQGAGSRRKTVRVRGVSLETARSYIKKGLE